MSTKKSFWMGQFYALRRHIATTSLFGAAPGIVWAGAGAGDGPPETAEALDYARKKGSVVVVATRGGSGRVIRTQGYKTRGLVSADNLIPVKAVALLMLALNQTQDVEELQRMFNTY